MEPSEQQTDPPASEENPSVIKKKAKKKILFYVGMTKYPVVKYVGRKMLEYKLTEKSDDLWDVMWTDSAVTPDQFDKLKLFQKINHFPGMYSLARKNHLGRHLMRMREKFPTFYRFFPQTYLLPADYSLFRAACTEKNKKAKTFIVKPEASCQGRGIYLTKNHDAVDPMDHVVIQHYVEKPYLIDNLKFDLRIYVLIAGCDPLRIFIHKEGLARFATEEYKPPKGGNLDNLFMHLTNYAINKRNKNFVFNKDQTQDSEGHKRSLASLLQLLESQGHNVEELMHKIEKMIVKMFCSVQPILAHNYYSCQPQSIRNDMCFEVLGLDILLDHKLKPYLIEVNHTPSFTTDTPLDKNVKRSVIRDSLVLMNIDPKHRTKYFKDQKKEFEKRTMNFGKSLQPLQKEELVVKGRTERTKYENEHLGGFKRLFPQENEEEPYQEFMNYAKILWEKSTGTFNMKKPSEEVKKIEEAQQIKMKKEGNGGNIPTAKAIKEKVALNHKNDSKANSFVKRSQSQSSTSTKNTITSKVNSQVKIPKIEKKTFFQPQIRKIGSNRDCFEIPPLTGNNLNTKPNWIESTNQNGKFVSPKLLDFGHDGGLKTQDEYHRNSSFKHFV